MPRRLVSPAPHVFEIETFDPAPMIPTRIRVRTEFASGKHGTVTAMFDGRNFEGQVFDPELRMFRSDGGRPMQGPQRPGVVGTTGVGRVIEVGA